MFVRRADFKDYSINPRRTHRNLMAPTSRDTPTFSVRHRKAYQYLDAMYASRRMLLRKPSTLAATVDDPCERWSQVPRHHETDGSATISAVPRDRRAARAPIALWGDMLQGSRHPRRFPAKTPSSTTGIISRLSPSLSTIKQRDRGDCAPRAARACTWFTPTNTTIPTSAATRSGVTRMSQINTTIWIPQRYMSTSSARRLRRRTRLGVVQDEQLCVLLPRLLRRRAQPARQPSRTRLTTRFDPMASRRISTACWAGEKPDTPKLAVQQADKIRADRARLQEVIDGLDRAADAASNRPTPGAPSANPSPSTTPEHLGPPPHPPETMEPIGPGSLRALRRNTQSIDRIGIATDMPTTRTRTASMPQRSPPSVSGK
jgi:hypothetical protein